MNLPVGDARQRPEVAPLDLKGETRLPGAAASLQADGGTISLGEWQLLRRAHLGHEVDFSELYHLEHLGLVDIDDEGSVRLTPEGRLTLRPF